MTESYPEEQEKLDRMYMERALELAAKGRGTTTPNPMVGAVIVKEGRIIGEGYHIRAGEGHAEVNAFKNATNANKNHFSGWFVGIWGQYSNSSEIDEQVTMMSLKKLRDDLNFMMQEYKEKSMNIAAMHTQNFIKKLDAIIKPENEDLQTGQVIQ